MINYELIDPSSKFNYMGPLGSTEILLILAVVLLLFGGKKIPELMKGVGKGIKNFKDGMKEEDEKPPTEPPSDKK